MKIDVEKSRRNNEGKQIRDRFIHLTRYLRRSSLITENKKIKIYSKKLKTV